MMILVSKIFYMSNQVSISEKLRENFNLSFALDHNQSLPGPARQTLTLGPTFCQSP